MRGISKPARTFFKSTHGAIPSLRFNLPLLAFALFLGGALLVPGAPEVRIVSPGVPESVSSEGVVTLAWESDDPTAELTFELQQSAGASFAETRTRYLGPDRASVLTGFPESTVHFRVRAIDTEDVVGEWSEPVAVEIAYMPRTHVVILLSVGLVVFVATIGTLLAGHFRKSPAA